MLEISQVVLFSFFAPIGIFCLFWKFKKPFWSYAVYVPLLSYSIFKNIFWYGTYDGFWQEIKRFMGNDSAIVFYLCWLPGLIGFVLIQIIYFIKENRFK